MLLGEIRDQFTQELSQLELQSKQQEIEELRRVLADPSLNALQERIGRQKPELKECDFEALSNRIILTEHVEMFRVVENVRIFEIDPTGKYMIVCSDKLLKIGMEDKRMVELVALPV